MFEAIRRGGLVPEIFQRDIINGAVASLMESDIPCLLRAPTASGKTLMLGRIAERISEPLQMMWLWFVPYGFLASQTIGSIFDNCPGLLPLSLASERRSDHHPGDVLVGSIGLVSVKDRDMRKMLRVNDVGLPSLQRIVARARSRGMKIGIVVDEAHIAVDSETEFGRFCKALMPDRMLLATATPRDVRLNAFVTASGHNEFKDFPVSRDAVVDAALNKRYVEAHVFKVDTAWTGITDVKRTALRQAWLQNIRIKERLAFLGIPTIPLMLVQIENGATPEETVSFLTKECGVPLSAIGRHTTDDPDPKLMASIANDTTYEVLIFKESAGTGFDAPRAFVLVSMKNVIDAKYATQFLGRIMRVERSVRARLCADPAGFDPSLDTGYLYLANVEAQLGFEKAVAALQLMTTEADGVLSRLTQFVGKDGSIIVTNRPERQLGLPMRFPTPLNASPEDEESLRDDPRSGQFAGSLVDLGADVTAQPVGRTKRPKLFDGTYKDEKSIDVAARAMHLKLYPLRRETPHLPVALYTEVRPEIGDLLGVAQSIAGRLNYDLGQIQQAVTVALRGTSAIELITELTQNESFEREIRGVFDAQLAAREAGAVLRALPQLEEADRRGLLSTLSARVERDVERVLEIFEEATRPRGADLLRLVRNVTNLIIKSQSVEIGELYHHAMSRAVKSVQAEKLPDAVIFPVSVPLLKASRNIYGVFPPTIADGRILSTDIYADERRLLESATYLRVALDSDESYNVTYCDSTWWANKEEDRFARSIDRAKFVYWWHRNPPRKPYSIAVVRGDTNGNFFPDFVVCLASFTGDKPRTRLIETKESLKDAVRKASRQPKIYGKVIFITKDGDRFRMVTTAGQLGAIVDDDLESLRDELRQTSLD